MMFHRADPEVAGFGVTTLTPGLIRSSQPVMCFGLPGRTIITTVESLTIPLVGPSAQFESTSPACTGRPRSGEVENATTSAGWPAATARLCAPDAANEVLNAMPLPPGVCAYALLRTS